MPDIRGENPLVGISPYRVHPRRRSARRKLAISDKKLPHK
jgi:hypothetical protein